MTATGLRLAVVGGGASVSTLVDQLAARPELRGTDLRLVGHDPQRTATVARHLQARLERHRAGWTLEAGTDLAALAAGADLVVLMVRVGSAAARGYDEDFPGRWGLVGDEGIGPGGIANAWRTVPVLRTLARTIESAAPTATVLNLVAPLGVTTRALLECGLRAVGVCELPTVTMNRLRARLPEGARTSWCVAGLNHLSWVWSAPGDDRRRELLRDAARAEGLVDEVTWRRFGAVPMPYYYRVVEPVLGACLGVRQPAGRAAELAELSARALERMAAHPGAALPELAARPTPWFEHALVPTITALAGGDPWRGTVNVHNGVLLPELPTEVVVEVPATVDRTGVAPERAPARIEDIERLVEELSARPGRRRTAR